MARKSLKFNAFLSAGQKLLSIIFPLITFPYISRVLQVDDIGKISFASSIISYFVLIAGLGINNYATREGAKIRKDKNQLNIFCSEIFSINILSTLFSYICLILLFCISKKLQSYSVLIIIHSFSIVGTTLGLNWVFSIEEDYLYITIRTFVTQIVSLVLMLLLVKTSEDYLIYAMITVFANIGVNLFNFLYARKYVSIKILWPTNFKKHIKPIMIIFASAIAVTIYVESDTTLLGFLCDDYSVGLYSRAAKIYTIIKQMVAAVVVVALPNLASMDIENNFTLYTKKVNSLFCNMVFVSFPIGIGLACTASDIIYIAAGKNYLSAGSALSILGISSIFAILSSFTTYCCLLPLKYEKVQLYATIISAILNVCLNLIVLPSFAQDGAAATTLISEAIVFFCSFLYLIHNKNYRSIFYIKKKYLCALVLACLWIVFFNLFISSLSMTIYYDFILKVIISIVGYFGILKMFGYTIR